MRIAIVGIGAMGSLLGAYLGEVADVTLIGHWPAQVAAIREQGLGLEHPDGRHSSHHPAITDDPATAGSFDVALVVVKSHQTPAAADLIAGILQPDGLAVTLQNGLNNCATLRAALGAARAALAVTAEGAMMQGPGRVRHAGHGPTHFGRDMVLGDSQLALLPQVVALFERAGFEAYLVDETDSLVWGKLAVNAAINPLSALLRVPNGFLVQHAALINLMSRAAHEVAAVAEAQGIRLPSPDAAERAMQVARATAHNRSSMLQDIDRGAPTEVEAICGAVARVGRELGVATPLNVRLCRLVRQISQNGPLLEEPGDVTGLLRLLDEG